MLTIPPLIHRPCGLLPPGGSRARRLILPVFAVDVAIYATVDAWPLLALWTMVGAVIKGHVCAWNHPHQHVAMFKPAPLNRLLESVFALQTEAVRAYLPEQHRV